jgi:uncharacterized protein (DUF342 family)
MRVEVLACNDGLEAKLSIRDFNLNAWRELFPSPLAFKSYLLAQGLAPDLIADAAVDALCSQIAEAAARGDPPDADLREAQSLILASGVAPTHEEAEGLLFHKSYLSEPRAVEALDRELQAHGFDAAAKAVNPDCLVDAGHAILSFLSVKEGKAGRDVYGKEIPFHPYTASLPAAGHGIVKLEKKWVAKDQGALVFIQDTLKVIGAGGTLPGLIRVSDDKLQAWLILNDEEVRRDQDSSRAFGAIQEAMDRMGLLPMRDEARIRGALEAFLREGTEQEVLLLEGSSPQRGRDGAVELLIDPEPDLPDPEAVGNMDFKAFTFFRAVAAGDRLARVLPPQAGLAGTDVFGNITLPQPGAPVQVKPGRNTGFAPDDPCLILATKNGKLAVEDGIPYVVDTLKIAQDVSFRTGNLNFPGSIEVEGNVLDRFAIQAKGDVGIAGVVENGVVVSEGAILIKGGVIGGGSGFIKSKLSSVTIGFIHNQRIESHSNIVVYNEVLNGQLMARKSILMKSAAHSVVGGHLVACEGIEIHNSGNEAGAKTILEVGKDYEIEAELLRKRETLVAVRADLDFLEKKKAKLGMIVRWEAGANPESRLLERRVAGVAALLDRIRKGLIAKLNELEAALYIKGDCHISISGTAYPGTVLKYRDKVIPINEAMRGKRWLFRAP